MEQKLLNGYRRYFITANYSLEEQKELITRAGNLEVKIEELVMECIKPFDPGEEWWMRKVKIDRVFSALREVKQALTDAERVVDTDFVALNQKRKGGKNYEE